MTTPTVRRYSLMTGAGIPMEYVLASDYDALEARCGELEEVLRYAVDNPEFDSQKFDSLARAALTREAK